MAVGCTSIATPKNWSDDDAWKVNDVGTASGADGVLASGVLTPTVSPAWTVSALVGRRIKLDATWYSISANTATTATITSPPADATYAYLLGGAPVAGDTVIIGDGTTATQVITLDANPASLLSISNGDNTSYIACATDRTITLTGDVGIASTTTSASGFIRVSANTLTITHTGGAGKIAAQQITGGGICLLTSGTGGITLSNSGGTAMYATHGILFQIGGTGNNTITGLITGVRTMCNVAAACTTTIHGDIHCEASGYYSVNMSTTNGHVVVNGNMKSPPSKLVGPARIGAAANLTWIGSRTLAAGVACLINVDHASGKLLLATADGALNLACSGGLVIMSLNNDSVTITDAVGGTAKIELQDKNASACITGNTDRGIITMKDLSAGNVKDGVTIHGVAGTYAGLTPAEIAAAMWDDDTSPDRTVTA